MIEVLFFAAIAAYLFFRLWSVLGTRTGHERPQEPFLENVEEDHNVIIMPRRQVNGMGEDADYKTISYGPYAHQLDQIQRVEPHFDLDTFQEKAALAYKMIVNAFNSGDLEMLRALLDKKVFKEFGQAVEKRTNLGQTIKNEFIGPVVCTTEGVEVLKTYASVTLKIYSQQRLITYDQRGEILDNEDESVVRLTEYWTFSRELGSDDPTWLLTKTQNKLH